MRQRIGTYLEVHDQWTGQGLARGARARMQDAQFDDFPIHQGVQTIEEIASASVSFALRGERVTPRSIGGLMRGVWQDCLGRRRRPAVDPRQCLAHKYGFIALR
jgi:hypothetical protein